MWVGSTFDKVDRNVCGCYPAAKKTHNVLRPNNLSKKT